jgi:3-oxoacyl-[acyl-carrier protein] reductase
MLETGLSERVCIVTGAAKGIGLAAAEILAGEGAKLVLCDRDAAGLEAVGLEGERVVADVSRRDEVERLLGGVRERFGRLDVLIHCAGIYRITKLPDVTDEEWDSVIDVNLRSSYLLAQGAVELMREHGDGRIVLFGSYAARTGGLRAGVPYAASKAGVEGVTRNVAQYAGPLGIRVNCVHPGYTETPMNTILSDEAIAEAVARTPLRRASQASEQAAMAVVLASDIASFVHGATLDVNGGMYMA